MISSVVMMMVLVSGLTAASSVSAAMRDQYYAELARQAAQSGAAAAKGCFKANSNAATWTSALKPNTNCSGVQVLSCVPSTLEPRCGVVESQTIRSTFSVSTVVTDAGQPYLAVKGTAYALSKQDRSVKRVYTSQQRLVIRGTSIVQLP